MMLFEVTHMKDTIIDLWYGNIAPCEHCGSHDPRANKLIHLIEQNREKLSDGLTDAQKDRFQKYIDCSEEYLVYMTELAFQEGFVIANKLAAESLQQ